MIKSPGSIKLSNLDLSKSFLSDVLPPWSLDADESASDGVMHTKDLRLLYFYIY